MSDAFEREIIRRGEQLDLKNLAARRRLEGLRTLRKPGPTAQRLSRRIRRAQAKAAR